MRFTSLLALGLLPVFATAGAAAPLDCQKPSSDRDRVICSDKYLSEAVEKVDQGFAAAQALLSADGRRQLQDSQATWQRALETMCAVKSGVDITRCIGNLYRDRAGDLTAIQRKGPFIFSRVDRYDVVGAAPDLFLRHVAYPQIDVPSTPVEKQWNAEAAQKWPPVKGAICDGREGDVTFGYSLGLATDRLINLNWWDWYFCHGAAHGFGGNSVETKLLQPTLRLLEPADLFRSDSGWRERLSALALAIIVKANGGPLAEHHEKNAVDGAADPRHWLLRPDGLQIIYGLYSLGPYAFNPDVLVPWSGLKDVIVANPPIP